MMLAMTTWRRPVGSCDRHEQSRAPRVYGRTSSWCGIKHLAEMYSAIGSRGHRSDRPTGDHFRYAPFYPEIRESEGAAGVLGCLGIPRRENASTRREGNGTRWRRANALPAGVLFDLA